MARNITIKTSQEIEIPDGFICSGRHNCTALTEITPGDGMRLCCYFNKNVFWSDRAGYYQKCEDCVNATMEYLGGKGRNEI